MTEYPDDDDDDNVKQLCDFRALPEKVKHRLCLFFVLPDPLTETMSKPQIVKDLNGRTPRPPKFLRLCRETREISAPLYYANNCFDIKCQPRFESRCPFTSWTSAIGGNVMHLTDIRMSLYEAGRIYLYLSITPRPAAFPSGTVTVEWPLPPRESSSFSEIFTAVLSKKYPEATKDRLSSTTESTVELNSTPHAINTHDVVEVVEDIFNAGKQAAGARSERDSGKSMTMRDALYRGFNTDYRRS